MKETRTRIVLYAKAAGGWQEPGARFRRYTWSESPATIEKIRRRFNRRGIATRTEREEYEAEARTGRVVRRRLPWPQRD